MNETPPSQRHPQRIALLPGDGIGNDVVIEATKILETVGERWSLPLELLSLPWGADHYLETGETLPEGALEDLRDNYSAILVGAYGDPRVPSNVHAKDILLGIRFGLDLYINFRPVKLFDPRLCPLKDKGKEHVDFVVFRENTEGAYVSVGGNFKKGTKDEIAVQEEIHSYKGVMRILRAAFEYAQQHGKTKVCMSDKSNVMQYAHGLWRRCFAELGKEYPGIETRHLYVDALTVEMIRAPESFEVIVTNNLFGDIVTDLGAALQGGMGLAASANLHPGQTSLFEPVHGTAPDLVGTDKANPMGAVLSAALMLEDLGHREAAAAVEQAVIEAIHHGDTTADLGGNLRTSEVGDRLAKRLRAVG